MADGVWKDAESSSRKGARCSVTLGRKPLARSCSAASRPCDLSVSILSSMAYSFGMASWTPATIAFRGYSDERPAILADELGDCQIRRAMSPAPSTWVSIYGARNRVDHCRFVGKEQRQPSSDRLAQRTAQLAARSTTNLRPPHSAEKTVARPSASATARPPQNSRTIVESNLFEDCDGEVEIISNKSCENIYRPITFRTECRDPYASSRQSLHDRRKLVLRRATLRRHPGYRRGSLGSLITISTTSPGEKFFSAIGFMAAIANSELSIFIFQVKCAPRSPSIRWSTAGIASIFGIVASAPRWTQTACWEDLFSTATLAFVPVLAPYYPARRAGPGHLERQCCLWQNGSLASSSLDGSLEHGSSTGAQFSIRPLDALSPMRLYPQDRHLRNHHGLSFHANAALSSLPGCFAVAFFPPCSLFPLTAKTTGPAW